MNKKKAGLSFGWVVFLLIGVMVTAAWAAGGFTSSQTTAVYGVYDNDKNATLVIKETTTDTLKGVEAGTSSVTGVDMHAYTQFATYLRVHEWDADTGSILLEAQVSVNGSDWWTVMSDTARTADSTFHETEWTLPPALYFRVVWTGLQNTVDTTLVDHIYHVFQQ